VADLKSTRVIEEGGPSDRPCTEVVKKAEALAQKAKARSLARMISSETQGDAPGTQGEQIASVDLVAPREVEMEQISLFTSHDIRPNNEYPTLLTRLPIFRPSHRSKQNRLLDQDNALQFVTPFGSGRRHGPPLTILDEDTLIAIMRLRSKCLIGKGQHLPFPVPVTYQADERGRVRVHTVTCTITQINTEKRLTDAGPNYRATLDSVKRLAATSLEINVNSHERYFGAISRGTTIKLLDVVWTAMETDGFLLIQFSPLTAAWLENEYTYIDWGVRLQLSDLGKSLHRFLSGQPKHYKGHLGKIALTVGYDGPARNLKPRFRVAFEELKSVSWLQSYEFSGTGRKSPISIEIYR
jgi:hypothetical protein